MRSFVYLRFGQSGRRRLHLRGGMVLTLLVSALCVGPSKARAQVVPAGDQGRLRLSAGVMGLGNTLQYGQRKMLGVAGFVDADTKHGIGIEEEGRWLEFHQTANVHAETYSIGGRYHFNLGRFQPYAKGLVGFGDFTFPYNSAHGRSLVITAGGGVDIRWTHRIYVRVADFEFQDWPQFTSGNMTSLGMSAGLGVRIF